MPWYESTSPISQGVFTPNPPCTESSSIGNSVEVDLSLVLQRQVQSSPSLPPCSFRAEILHRGWFCSLHPPQEPLAMSGDSHGCHNLEKGATNISWMEARDSVKHTPMHRTDPHSKELANPKCQWCYYWEILLQNLKFSLLSRSWLRFIKTWN